MPGLSAPPDDAQQRASLRAVAGGDCDALARLYRQQHGRLARFLRRCTAQPDLIEEVINDTMWVVWSRAADFRGDSTVSTWITGIAYRTMLSALRGRAPGEEVGESMLPPEQFEQAMRAFAADADRGSDAELLDWLTEGLRHLPDDQRLTLEMAYGLGHSCEEIATIMGCAVGTVKARMFHARVRLRSVMPQLAEPLPRRTG
jgi:RNA polymerase sigma-70 factor, ECF subfamily